MLFFLKSKIPYLNILSKFTIWGGTFLAKLMEPPGHKLDKLLEDCSREQSLDPLLLLIQ